MLSIGSRSPQGHGLVKQVQSQACRALLAHILQQVPVPLPYKRSGRLCHCYGFSLTQRHSFSMYSSLSPTVTLITPCCRGVGARVSGFCRMLTPRQEWTAAWIFGLVCVNKQECTHFSFPASPPQCCFPCLASALAKECR